MATSYTQEQVDAIVAQAKAEAKAENGAEYKVTVRQIPEFSKSGTRNKTAGDWNMSVGTFRTSVGVNMGKGFPTAESIEHYLQVLGANVGKLAGALADVETASLVPQLVKPVAATPQSPVAVNGRQTASALR